MPLTVDELSRFDDMRVEWDKLLSQSSDESNIFLTWDWQRLWWQILGSGVRVRILAVRFNQELVGIWPLMQEDRRVSFLGGVEVCDYLDVIARRGQEAEVIRAGLDYLTKAGELSLDLRFVPCASPTLRYMPELAADAGWNLQQSVDEVCPSVVLPATWDVYLSSLSKKNRHELRRKLRRLAEAGEVQWQVTSGAEDLERDISDFLRLHRSSGTEKAAFMTDEMECFFRSIVAGFRPEGRLQIIFLALDGLRVASTLCIDQEDELWVYNSGFDRTYAYCSVGLAVKAYCIEHAIAQGKRKVDFLRGREPYKYDLGALDYPVYRLQLEKR